MICGIVVGLYHKRGSFYFALAQLKYKFSELFMYPFFTDARYIK